MNEGNAQSRREVLADLLQLRKPLEAAVAAVRQLPWDSEEELIGLTTEDVLGVLQRYLSGGLTAKEVERWANTIESREDVGFGAGDDELLRRFVFETANPQLAEAISPAYA